MTNIMKKRCAIYTRKSTDDGLEQEFNSLDAQRESGENYIASQKANGWACLAEHYDDGGVSGGTLERPALKRLLQDCEAGKVDIIVVYKIDRLSRSLVDFAELSTMFDRLNVSFVSVTQEINTSTSSGRMMLNILITFAQYEREVITERIRDKISAAKKRGKHCGGYPVLGYDSDVDTKSLVVNTEEAKAVRFIYDSYIKVGSAKEVARLALSAGITNKRWLTRKGKQMGGATLTNATIYNILNNPLYIGKVKHHDSVYNGEHEAIIDMASWNGVQKLLKSNCASETKRKSCNFDPFRGILKCGYCGGALGLTYTKKGSKKYFYYICVCDTKRAVSKCEITRVPAGEMSKMILHQIGAIFRTPSCVAAIEQACSGEVTPAEIHEAFNRLDLLWESLFPTEQQKLLSSIIAKASVYIDKIDIEIKTEGIQSFIAELQLFHEGE